MRRFSRTTTIPYVPYLAEISLEAAILAVSDNTPRILIVDRADGPALPAGPLRGDDDRTLELGLRRWITEQTGIEVGYVEQLYTFGDMKRNRSSSDGPRHIGVAYLALIREAQPQPGATWLDWYELFPWEDHRNGPADLLNRISILLHDWAGSDETRQERAQIAFGLDGTPWDPVRVLERYELLYGAGLVKEWSIDQRDRAGVQRAENSAELGRHMARDHRRVAATGLERLRGKLTYRPVVFELLPDEFTLAQLQGVVEALLGTKLHTQNFRRLVKQQGLVDDTGETVSTGGRPAKTFRFRREVLLERPGPGLWRR